MQSQQVPPQVPPPTLPVVSTNNTQNAAFEMLMNAIGSALGPVVHQLITSDPSLVHIKGWQGMSALHRACLIGDYNIVLMLVQANSDVNALTNFEESPLHYASKRGNPTIVHLLVQCGAKTDCRDKRGRSVLHHAAENGAVQTLKYFEDACGLKFQEVDSSLQSALHIACSLGHLEVCKFLISNERCDLRQADIEGNLPIHLSAKGGNAHMTWLLLSASGVSAGRTRNKHGFTALDMAMQNDKTGHKKTASFLQYYQSKPENTKVTGPLKTWYFLLLYPFTIFSIVIFITRFLTTYQYIVFLIAGAQVLIQAKGLSARMPDISRWPNPFFIGFFSAGIFHTIICYVWLMFIHTYQYAIFLLLSVTTIPCLLFFYYKFLVQDPGRCTSSVRDPQSGKSLTLVDLCRMQQPKQVYCPVCDMVNNMLTKHCKLCDICVYGMDHHCLFLLKCVARNNHALFVRLIIACTANMLLYCLSFCIYTYTLYGQLEYTEIFHKIIHQEMWPFSLLLLNAGSSFWSINLLIFQFSVVSRGNTCYFGEGFHRDQNLTTRHEINNFVAFLLGRPLPHKNQYSPFVQHSELI